MNKIQVHCPYQGGSFGGWSQMYWNFGGTYCAAVVAKRTGRPVKWSFTRREDFYGGQLDEGVYSYKVGAKLDGTITAVKGKVLLVNHDDAIWYLSSILSKILRSPIYMARQNLLR